MPWNIASHNFTSGDRGDIGYISCVTRYTRGYTCISLLKTAVTAGTLPVTPIFPPVSFRGATVAAVQDCPGCQYLADAEDDEPAGLAVPVRYLSTSGPP